MDAIIVFEYYPKNTLPPDADSQTQKLLSSCFWSEDKTPEEIAKHNDQFCSQSDRIGYAFAKAGDEVAGVAIAYKRTTDYKGKSVILGGVGGVCTKEEFRRQGIATSLVKILMEKLSDEGCDMAYLCTNTEKFGKLYGASGFELLRHDYTYLGKSGKRYYDSGGMIAPVKSVEVFREVLESKSSFDIGTGDW